MFSCYFVWKEGYNLEKTQEKHELSLAIVGGMMAIKKTQEKYEMELLSLRFVLGE